MIEVEGLTKRFVDKDVVADVSFFVPEGEVLGFLGPNGAGKTTTMRMITGFLPATSGNVRVGGLDVARDPLGVRARIGYLPENVALYPEMRVEEYLRFRAAVEGSPRRGQGEGGRGVRRLHGRRRPPPARRHAFEGVPAAGGLAGALIHRPPVLILDEPTVGLDPRQIVKIRELIIELGREHTVILSTHILPEVEQVCRRVLIIDDGKLVADGTPAQLRGGFSGGAEINVQLDAPATDARAALEALPGASNVRDDGGGRFRLAADGGADLRREVFKLAVARGWVLLEMARTVPSLEDVFLRLTTHDADAAREGQLEEVANA